MKDKVTVWATVLTVGYLVAWGVFSWLYWHERPMKWNEMGDTLAGVFGPIAFVWLVASNRQQSRQIDMQREEIATARSRQQKEDAERDEERLQMLASEQPMFHFAVNLNTRFDPNWTVLILHNRGAPCTVIDCSIGDGGQFELTNGPFALGHRSQADLTIRGPLHEAVGEYLMVRYLDARQRPFYQSFKLVEHYATDDGNIGITVRSAVATSAFKKWRHPDL